jgi:hypothetical protein
MVGADEEPTRRIEPRILLREELDGDVPVRADDRKIGDAAIELETERAGLDVPVGPLGVEQVQTATASRSIAGAYNPLRAAEFIFARW